MHQNPAPPKIVVICGPTGIGKTSTAIDLCEAVGGSIVGADSMQVYRAMDIGTAKPTPQERVRVRHDLIDVADPDENLDAARYEQMASQVISQLQAAGLTPCVVGGTGLYIKVLLHGIFPDAPRNPAVRKVLGFRLEQEGAPALHHELTRCDPRAAERIHPNDAPRIVRALEVFETTGRPLTDLQRCHGFRQQRYAALQIGLNIERQELFRRIDQRVDRMIEQGLLTEVRTLLERGYSPQLKSMQSIGYRHMTAYIAGHLNWKEAVRTLKRDTRRYAKRQLTWFMANPKVLWFRPDQSRSILDEVRSFLQTGV